MPVVQDAWEGQEKNKRLDLFNPQTSYQMKVGDIIDKQLQTLPTGPADTEWEYSISSITGKNYPNFVNLNQATQTLEFRPDKQEYD